MPPQNKKKSKRKNTPPPHYILNLQLEQSYDDGKNKYVKYYRSNDDFSVCYRQALESKFVYDVIVPEDHVLITRHKIGLSFY